VSGTDRDNHLEYLITNSVASGTVHDNDLEDNNVIDISSDNSPAVRTKWKWVMKHIKTEPPSQCQAWFFSQGMLSNITQAFNPQAQAKHNESRHARVFESMHMQYLSPAAQP